LSEDRPARAGVAPPPLLAALLFVPGLLYSGLVRLRNRLYDARLLPVRRLPCPVISLGNLTVGGTGKSPLASFVTGALSESGYRVGVLSRGYRRRSGSRSLLVSDGKGLLLDAAQAGDEPYLIARDNPSAAVAVGADRIEAARLLGRFSPETIVLDDAFQHRSVARDLDLLLVDGEDPWGNGRMLPLGPLREPPRGLSRASAVVVTRGNGVVPLALRHAIDRFNPAVPVFHARIAPRGFVGADGQAVDLVALKGWSAYAVSGIARPDRFEAEIRALGLRLVGSRRFPDHHPYRTRDLDEVRGEARALKAEVLVTTEKDLARIEAGREPGPPFYALALAVSFPKDRDLASFLLDRLGERRAEPAGGVR
jgi:tetraacyldisaccharide 4'-kinase